MVNILSSISGSFSSLEDAAERIIQQRFNVFFSELDPNSENYDKVSQLSDSVKVTIKQNGETLVLEEDHDESLYDAYIGSPIDEGMVMLDTFITEWVEDLITEDNPEIIAAIEEFAYDQISAAFGGG